MRIISILFFTVFSVQFTSEIYSQQSSPFIKLNLYQKYVQASKNGIKNIQDWHNIDFDFEMNLTNGKVSMYDKQFRTTERYKIYKANAQMTNSLKGIYAFNCYDYSRKIDFVLLIQLPKNDGTEPLISVSYPEINGFKITYFFRMKLPENEDATN